MCERRLALSFGFRFAQRLMSEEQNIKRLRDLSPYQWKSGIAAWLGWLFDGLDMHLYTLVATPFVASLMMASLDAPEQKAAVDQNASIIQAAFLVGWAFGGAFFGRLGDRMGRSRALILTILTYACFTGLSFFAQTWWQLMIFRFLAALGIGGEWAVGASLLSETWPKSWRPWIAATLQSAVNLGVMLACLAGYLLQGNEPKWIFLVGIFPALITLWIRKAVPETEEWTEARSGAEVPGVSALFGPEVRGVTLRVLLICSVSLTAHWAFMFWQASAIRSHEAVAALSASAKNEATVVALLVIMVGSLIGNFLSGGLAKLMGYRQAISINLALYFMVMAAAFVKPWSWDVTMAFYFAIGACQGVFGLFTMCLPPLFPTLIRTTGAGFCYNFGRIVAAAGTVFFGLFAPVGDYRATLLFASFLFLPAAIFGLMLPEEKLAPVQVGELAD
jgi:MFS family permease